MTRLNDKIARLNAFKEIIATVEHDINSTKQYVEQCKKNHEENPEHPYYAQWATEEQEKAKHLENALKEIIELAVSK